MSWGWKGDGPLSGRWIVIASAQVTCWTGWAVNEHLFGALLTKWAQCRRVAFALSHAVQLGEFLPGSGQEQEVRLGNQPWCFQSMKWEGSVLLRQQAGFFSPPLISTWTDEWAKRRKNLGCMNCCWYILKISKCKYADFSDCHLEIFWSGCTVSPDLKFAGGIQKFSFVLCLSVSLSPWLVFPRQVAISSVLPEPRQNFKR